MTKPSSRIVTPDAYWIYTTATDDKMTVHKAGCRMMRLSHSHRRPGIWTGPLTIEKIENLPPTSYNLCRSCFSPLHPFRLGLRRKVRLMG